jgi:hypothetical protein
MGDSLVFTAGQVLCAAGYRPFWLSVIHSWSMWHVSFKICVFTYIGAQNVCVAAQIEKYFKKF